MSESESTDATTSDFETPQKRLRRENSNQEILENAKNLNDKQLTKKVEIPVFKTNSISDSQLKRLPPHPKKRLNIIGANCTTSKKNEIFRFGNYSRYYSYRNQKDFHDIRLDIFNEQKDLFKDKEILDIGCNSGMITIEIAKRLQIERIIGIDIDKSLINKVTKYIEKKRKYFIGAHRNGFPFNIKFVPGNYVVRDDVLLEIEKEQFDVILCLSVTKWIHLNFGDAGLKQAFKRIFLQLRSGGKLILEAQPWAGYKRRKKLTIDISNNYKSIKFFPIDFTSYLLGPEVGFSEVNELGIPEHSVKGFCRPIQVFYKN